MTAPLEPQPFDLVVYGATAGGVHAVDLRRLQDTLRAEGQILESPPG